MTFVGVYVLATRPSPPNTDIAAFKPSCWSLITCIDPVAIYAYTDDADGAPAAVLIPSSEAEAAAAAADLSDDDLGPPEEEESVLDKPHYFAPQPRRVMSRDDLYVPRDPAAGSYGSFSEFRTFGEYGAARQPVPTDTSALVIQRGSSAGALNAEEHKSRSKAPRNAMIVSERELESANDALAPSADSAGAIDLGARSPQVIAAQFRAPSQVQPQSDAGTPL